MDMFEKIEIGLYGYLLALSVEEKAQLIECYEHIAGGIIPKIFREAFKMGYKTATRDLNREYLHKN